jgi:hypothetical protein
MDAIIKAKEHKDLRWSGFISGDTQFPKTQPAKFNSKEAFNIFAQRVEYCHKATKSKSCCTITIEMDNPKPRKKDPAAVCLVLSGKKLNDVLT